MLKTFDAFSQYCGAIALKERMLIISERRNQMKKVVALLLTV